MAKTLIVHVGPGKCGSTSIQTDLSRPGSLFDGRSIYPPNATIRELDTDRAIDTAPQLLEPVTTLFGNGEVGVVSHEVLFQRPMALRNIVRFLRPQVDEVIVVGYSRRQSGFIESAYKQWLFRSPERFAEVRGVLVAAGLEPSHFTGLEAFFIAAVKTNMASSRQLSNPLILDWHAGYSEIVRLLEPFGAKVSAGYIPREGYEFSLLADFYRRCGYPSAPLPAEKEPVANAQFDAGLVEAVHLAVQFGLPVPGPHEHNRFFEQNGGVPPLPAAGDEGRLLDVLKDYVDTYHWDSNRAFSGEHGLAEDYFRPRRIVSREAAEDAVLAEAARRRADPDIVAHRNAALAGRLAAIMFERYLKTGR